LLGWDYSANTAEGIIDINSKSGNQVHVQMHDGLPRWDAAINADVVSIGFEALIKEILGLPDQIKDSVTLLLSRLKKVGIRTRPALPATPIEKRL
jgi:hypothetical protein